MSIHMDEALSRLMLQESLAFRDRCNDITNDIEVISRLSPSTDKILEGRTAPSLLFYGFKQLMESFTWMITIRAMYFDYKVKQSFVPDNYTDYPATHLETIEIECEIDRDSILQYERRFPDDEFQYIANNGFLAKQLDDMERFIINSKEKYQESKL